MKIFHQMISMFIALFILIGCSSKKGTPVNLKVYLAGLGSLPAGIGDGGAMLYGRSNDGKLFGKKISFTDEVLDLPNGQWTFYAVFWDTTNAPLNGNVYCAKSLATLSGTQMTITMSASNSTCKDPEFSNGQYYVNVDSKVRFSDVFLEDCDELPGTGYTCGLLNQGNALSYRFVLSEFKKDPSIPFLFSSDNKQFSSCQPVSETLIEGSVKSRFPINFPLGNGVSPFVAQVQLFFGSSTCDESDPKGNLVVNLSGAQSLGVRKIVSNQYCNAGNSVYYASADLKLNEVRCRDDLGILNMGSCNLSSFPESSKRFLPEAQCANGEFSVTNPATKFLIAVPKSNICDRYLNQSSNIGSHPFSSGDGSRLRPYKICTEWQLNQIGEVDTPLVYSNKWYKLLNDLDMNKVGFGAYPFPKCTGVPTSVYDQYSNFNSIDKVSYGSCSAVASAHNNGFQGEFIGNGKTISNIRLNVNSADKLGFTRKLYSGARIYNLNFINPEFEARNKVGVVAGEVFSGEAIIQNIKIENADIRAKVYSNSGGFEAAGVAGWQGNNSIIDNVHVMNSSIEGEGHVAGVVGQSSGKILKSSFRGKILSQSFNTSILNAGGIAGLLVSGGEIRESFSEGLIHAQINRVGGIAGENGGAIIDSYSSMALFQNHQNPGYARLGGLVASNSGSITRSLFMGTYKQESISAMSTNSVTNSGTVTDSYSLNGSTAAGSVAPELNFRDGAVFNWMGSPSSWRYVSPSYPRLAYENRPCQDAFNHQSIVSQIGNGRGSFINPISICSYEQFKTIGPLSSGRFYKVLEDINLGSFTLADQILNFAGTLLGGDNYLYGLDMSKPHSTGGADVGVIKVNDGAINNLVLANNSLSSADLDDFSGILVGKNNGIINNVSMYFSSIQSYVNSGLIAGLNNGTISNSYVKNSKLTGDKRIGGIVSENSATGVIKKVSAHLDMKPLYTASDFNTFGGIVATNDGQVDQVSFRGNIKITTATSNSALYLGGIVGTNSGIISDALVKKDATITLVDTQKVGGIAGRTDGGNISRAVFLGKLIYDNSGSYATTGQAFHALVGYPITSPVFSHLVSTHTAASSLVMANTAGVVTGSGPYTVPLGAPVVGKTNIAAPSSDKLDGVSKSNNNGFIYPYTLSADHEMNVDLLLSNGDAISLYKIYPQSTIHLNNGLSSFMYSIPQLFNFSTYCPSGHSGPAGYEKCNSGFDMVYEDSSNSANNVGFNRLLDFYLAKMNGTAIPSNSPIWSLESGEDDGPRLVQLED